ncbi:MAG: serine--tRNA ligase [Candidatus Altiarchaeota archaeon]|nr:serine--tRNA ligase [Candidatus Altiarchaeota archaeon]
MLDVKLFRETPKIIEDSLKKRGMDTAIVKEIQELDKKWRQKQFELNQFRKERNELSKQISSGKKELVSKAKELKAKMDSVSEEVPQIEADLKTKLMEMPNILHKDVPVGKDDSENVPLRYWGTVKLAPGLKIKDKVKTEMMKFKPKDHQELLIPKYADIERAAKISGARFYYLKGKMVELGLALTQLSFDFLKGKGFEIVEPPYMMRRKAVEGMTSFSDFEDVLYKIDEEDLYLIATAEHPLGAMHMDEVLEKKQLPIKYAGISPSFRKEAGSHGRDTKGFFRVHRFNKIEQFVFSHPDKSWEIHDELIKNAEALFQKIEVPYRITDICTGDMGHVAARKYDLEAWLPGQGKFREVVSGSNCTDWQSRRLGIKFRETESSKPELVHTLNCTAFALQRTLIAIVENHQQEDGSVRVPKALWKYIDFKEL